MAARPLALTGAIAAGATTPKVRLAPRADGGTLVVVGATTVLVVNVASGTASTGPGAAAFAKIFLM
jgi:hypothetical protein